MIEKLKQLFKKRKDLLGEAKAVAAQAEAGDRTLTERDRAEIERLKSEIHQVDRDIKVQQDLIEQERNAPPAAEGALLVTGPSFAGGTAVRHVPARGAKTFTTLFPGAGRSMEGWESGTAYFKALALGFSDPRLVAASQLTNEGPLGGFAVPSSIAARTLDSALETSVILSRSKIVPMPTKEVTVWGFDSQDQTAGNLHGISAEWREDGESFSAQAGKIRKITLQAKKIGMAVEIANDLVADSNFAGEAESRFGEALGFELDDKLINGIGAGEPLGILNAPSKLSIAKESGQTADTIKFSNVVKLLDRLWTGAKNPVWIASPTTRSQLFQLTLSGGLTQAWTFEGGEMRLMGIPVVFSSKMPSVGDQGDLALVDLSQYVVGVRQEQALAVSPHAGFLRDVSTWRWISRLDAQDSWNGPMTPRVGATQSWLVVIDARA